MKLYWRVKLNGNWTWRPAEVIVQNKFGNYVVKNARHLEEEE